MWRGGCIIRSRFLGNIKTAFTGKPDLHDLLLDAFSIDALKNAEAGWRTATALGTELGIPLPAFRSALAFYDGYRSGKLPANLLEAQRDYFGAHTYERVDRPRGKFFQHRLDAHRRLHRPTKCNARVTFAALPRPRPKAPS